MSGFADRLDPELTTLALCWRIARRDGVTFGLTTHDRTIDLDGLCYASAPGMVPSAIGASDGLDVDTMEIAGALDDATITVRDLAAGRYDGAVADIFMVDWAMPAAGRLPLARGTLGRIEHSAGGFVAELRGPTAAFEAIVVENCSPDCRAELGDRRCRVDLAPRTVVVQAGPGASRDNVTVVAAGDLDRFVDGRLRPLAGPNAGIDVRIAAAEPGKLILFEPLPFALAPATRVELREGCDKRLATCAARFDNAVNFRGEPHVPGSDMLTRFPGV